MAQFVFMIRYPLNKDIVAAPFDVNIYTTDQVIVWKNLVEGTQWSTKRPRPIVFNEEWFLAGGREVEPVTAPDGAPLWTATGPGPRSEAAQAFTYEVYLEPIGGGEEIRVARRSVKPTGEEIAIDPDIWNQPQP